MKCNKCLKIIPKGEEIRFFNKYWRDEANGGYYCEDCWKKSKFRERLEREDRGDYKQPNSNKSDFPWTGLLFGILIGIVLTAFACFFWLVKKKDDD